MSSEKYSNEQRFSSDNRDGQSRRRHRSQIRSKSPTRTRSNTRDYQREMRKSGTETKTRSRNRNGLELSFERQLTLSDENSSMARDRRMYQDGNVLSSTRDFNLRERGFTNQTKRLSTPKSVATKEAIAVSKLVAKKLEWYVNYWKREDAYDPCPLLRSTSPTRLRKSEPIHSLHHVTNRMNHGPLMASHNRHRSRYIDLQSHNDLDLIKDAERLGQYASRIFNSYEVGRLAATNHRRLSRRQVQRSNNNGGTQFEPELISQNYIMFSSFAQEPREESADNIGLPLPQNYRGITTRRKTPKLTCKLKPFVQSASSLSSASTVVRSKKTTSLNGDQVDEHRAELSRSSLKIKQNKNKLGNASLRTDNQSDGTHSDRDEKGKSRASDTESSSSEEEESARDGNFSSSNVEVTNVIEKSGKEDPDSNDDVDKDEKNDVTENTENDVTESRENNRYTEEAEAENKKHDAFFDM